MLLPGDEGLSFTEVGKRLGELWKAMSTEEKLLYTQQADEDKCRVAELIEKDPELATANKSRKRERKAKHDKSSKQGERKRPAHKPKPREKEDAEESGADPSAAGKTSGVASKV
jgi:hypothetical protein